MEDRRMSYGILPLFPKEVVHSSHVSKWTLGTQALELDYLRSKPKSTTC
jgi:hypothetical protein